MQGIEAFPDILVWRDPMDFRKGRRSLAAFVQGAMGEKPFSETLFVFFNRRKTAVKCIYWDRTGFALWEKELEESLFHVPTKKLPEKIVLTQQQARWLLEGIDVWNIRPHKEVEYQYAV
jgi:transposase